MPSFAYEVRSELVNVVNFNSCCNKAQLNAMLKISAEVNEAGNRIDFISTNAAVARKVLILVKKVYKDIKTEVAVIRHKKFRTTHRYVIRIFLSAKTKPLLKAMKSYKFPIEPCCENAYLRGLFLACGSVNRPEAQYHLEIFTSSEETAKFIEKNMRKLGFPARTFARMDKFVVYMKDFDSICDFLYVIKAENAVERFEVARNLKDVKANVNRLINCETANLQRAVDASQKQIKDIKKVYRLKLTLPDELKEVAEARMENPDMTMPELAKKIFLSVSNFKHRMHKIHLLANPRDAFKPKKKKRGRKPKKKIEVDEISEIEI